MVLITNLIIHTLVPNVVPRCTYFPAGTQESNTS